MSTPSPAGQALPASLPIEPTHYASLGLPENASLAQIEAAWQADLARWPATGSPIPAPSLVLPGVPDSPALQAQARRLAYAVLSNAERRAVYDAWLAQQRAALAASSQPPRWWRRPRYLVGGALLLALLLWLTLRPGAQG